MPSYVFTGLVPTLYPFDRDAPGQPLGEAQPGDVRELDGPLDWQWTPADDSAGHEQAGPPEHPAGVSETAGPAAAPEPAPAPDGPQPAPPAAVPGGPQPFAVTADQQ